MPKIAHTQEWNSSRYAENARFVSDLGKAALDLLNPQPGERVLDLGCGDGALTEKIAAIGTEVVGVDGSPDMVSAAKRRGIDSRVADAYSLNFHSEFDAVFSNAALHWMNRDPDAVIKGVHRALKPGGCFVAKWAATEMWQQLRLRFAQPSTPTACRIRFHSSPGTFPLPMNIARGWNALALWSNTLR